LGIGSCLYEIPKNDLVDDMKLRPPVTFSDAYGQARRATGLTLTLTLAPTLKSLASPEEFSIADVYCYLIDTSGDFTGEILKAYNFVISGWVKPLQVLKLITPAVCCRHPKPHN